jgi:predicted secreted protein with PEFG-CTERM motif
VRFLLIPVLIFIIGSCTTIGLAHAQPSSFLVKDPSGQQNFNVNYSMDGGTVSSMSVNTQDASILVDINTTGNGTLTITLPRTLIDSTVNGQDDQFFVLVDGENVDFQESKSSTDRTLTIPFSDGSQEIEIMGTQVVPEFGPLVLIVFVIAVVSIIAVSKTRLKL